MPPTHSRSMMNIYCMSYKLLAGIGDESILILNPSYNNIYMPCQFACLLAQLPTIDSMVLVSLVHTCVWRYLVGCLPNGLCPGLSYNTNDTCILFLVSQFLLLIGHWRGNNFLCSKWQIFASSGAWTLSSYNLSCCNWGLDTGPLHKQLGKHGHVPLMFL